MTKFISIAIVAMLATVAVSAVNGYTLKDAQNQQGPRSQDITETHTEENIKDQSQKQHKIKSDDADPAGDVVGGIETPDTITGGEGPDGGIADMANDSDGTPGGLGNVADSGSEAIDAGADVAETVEGTGSELSDGGEAVVEVAREVENIGEGVQETGNTISNDAGPSLPGN